MTAKKRPKPPSVRAPNRRPPGSRGTEPPEPPRPPAKTRSRGAERSPFADSMESAMNALLDEADVLADSIARMLGLREARRPLSSPKRRAR